MQNIVNLHKQKGKNIAIAVAKKLKMDYNSQMSALVIAKKIDTSFKPKDIKVAIESLYDTEYLYSKLHGFTVEQLRSLAIYHNMKNAKSKNKKREEYIKYLYDLSKNDSNFVLEIPKTPGTAQDYVKTLNKKNLSVLCRAYCLQQFASKKLTLNELRNKVIEYVTQRNITIDQLKEVLNPKFIEKTLKVSEEGGLKYIDPDMEVKYIIQLADLHIRQYQRYDEYEQVFNKFISMMREQYDKLKDNTVVVVCGDIFHTKVTQRANALKLWNTFVGGVTQMFPMLVITGNHDYNMKSNDRDWISVTYPTDNFHHLNEIGEYHFKNVVFCASPLSQDTIYSCKKSMDKIYVQLYHGTINGSKLFTSDKQLKGLELTSFGEYDYLLLGDIHKHQYFGSNAAYSGSMIQQNFGESVGQHGFVLWNLIENKSDFIEVENEYAHVKVGVYEDKYVVDPDMFCFPEKKKLRLCFHSYAHRPELIEECIKDLKERGYEIMVTKHQKHYISVSEPVQDNHEVVIIDDAEYFKKKGVQDKLDDDFIESLLTLHESLGIEGSGVGGGFWSLKELRFKNLYCYGGDYENVITFDKDGFYKVFANNYMGKSAIIKIIKWALFQEASGINDFDILNRGGAESAYVQCLLQVGQECLVTRTIVKDEKLKSNIRIAHKLEGDGLVIEGKENIQSMLTDMIGTYDEFELVSSINNQDLGLLKRDALSVFRRLFCLDRFSECEQVAREKLSLLKGDMRVIKNKLTNMSLVNIEEIECGIRELEEQRELIKLINISEEEVEMKRCMEELQNIIVKEEVQCEPCNNEVKEFNAERLTGLIAEQNRLRNEIREVKVIADEIIERNLVRYNQEVEDLEYLLSGVKETKHKLEEENQRLAMDVGKVGYNESELVKKIKESGFDYVSARNSVLGKLRAGLVTAQDYSVIVKLLTEPNYGLLLEQVRKNKEVEIIIKKNKTELSVLNSALKEKGARLEEVRHKRYQLELQKNVNDCNKLVKEKSDIAREQMEAVVHEINVMNDIEKQNKTILDQQERYRIYVAAKEHNEKYDKIRNDLTITYNRLQESVRKASRVNENKTKQIIGLDYEIKVQQDLVESGKQNNLEMKNLESKVTQLTNNIYLWEKYRGFVEDSGLPSMILNEKIPIIQNEINNLLEKYTNFKIKMESVGGRGRRRIEIVQRKDDGEEIGLGSLSGYETLLVNIACKLAIKRSCTLHSPMFLMVDEVMSVISIENYELLPGLFEMLQECYHFIILITHIEEIKEMFSDDVGGKVVEIERNWGVSRLA